MDKPDDDHDEPMFASLEEAFDAYGWDDATRARVIASMDAEEESMRPHALH